MGVKDALRRFYRDFDRGNVITIGYTSYSKLEKASPDFPRVVDGKNPTIRGYTSYSKLSEYVKEGIIKPDTVFYLVISEGAILE